MDEYLDSERLPFADFGWLDAYFRHLHLWVFGRGQTHGGYRNTRLVRRSQRVARRFISVAEQNQMRRKARRDCPGGHLESGSQVRAQSASVAFGPAGAFRPFCSHPARLRGKLQVGAMVGALERQSLVDEAFRSLLRFGADTLAA